MKFTRATSLREAFAVLAETGPDVTLLAGGTDVVAQLHAGTLRPDHLVHVGSIAELAATDETDTGVVRLGASTTLRQLAVDESLARRLPALSAAASTVGGWQTQSVGTIGGNICNASPAADAPPALLVADAVVCLGSERGERRVTLDQFVLGRREIAREPDELVLGVDVDTLPPGAREVYLKVGPRRAMEVALVGLAMRLSVVDGLIDQIAIAATAVGPRPFRATDAEEALTGAEISRDRSGAQVVDPKRVRAAGVALTAAASPIDDVRATAAYRSAVLSGLLARAVAQCVAADHAQELRRELR